MRCFIGIDDTDNLESRGTGFRARQLGAGLANARLAVARGITRHQLLVHPEIRYTSHNSSACLDVDLSKGASWEALVEFCREYLLTQSAPGSDAGLCVAPADTIADEVVHFGLAAKSAVISRDRATALAQRAGLHLEGLTGDHGGVIGALAAVGLRRGGHDGRFIWASGVRELSGAESVAVLLASTGIESVETPSGKSLPADAVIRVDPWPRPILRDHRAVLLARPTGEVNVGYGWEILSKDEIRRY